MFFKKHSLMVHSLRARSLVVSDLRSETKDLSPAASYVQR